MAEALVGLLGLGLAAPGVIDIFLRAGNYVYGRLNEHRKAREFASNLKTFYIGDEVENLRLYMKDARTLLTDTRTEVFEKQRLENQFDEIKLLLRSIDEYATAVLSSERDPFHFKRNAALSELRTKSSRCKDRIENFRNRVQALKSIQNSAHDLLLRPQDFNWVLSENEPTSLSPSAYVRRGRTTHEIRGVRPETRRFMYEIMPYTLHTRAEIQHNLEAVLQKLATGGSGILPLLGYREDTAEEQFEIVFVLPRNGTDPVPLSSFIQDTEDIPALNVRLAICVQLAEAVLFLHSARLVHKSIRLDNIAVLPNENGESIDEHGKVQVFLFGFDVARPIDQYNTTLAGELLWQRRIYQHPERQRRVADKDYNMGHDIYSLAACALEILRWNLFVLQQTDQYGQKGYELSPEYLDIHRKLKEKEGDETNRDAVRLETVMSDPRRVQRVLGTCCQNELPRLAGNKVANVVKDCLKMVDTEEERGSSSVFAAEDRTQIGSQFVDRVLAQLREVANAI